MSRSTTFIEACLRGEALWTDIDAWVDAWHDSDDDVPLKDFLGMSQDEYVLWTERPEVLRTMIAAHHGNVTPLPMPAIARELDLAARTKNDASARAVLRWLRDTGRIAQ